MVLVHRALIAKRGLATVASSSSSFKIPVIDFSKFQPEAGPVAKQQTAEEIVTAFRESGFIYLRNHGISPGKTPSRLWYRFIFQYRGTSTDTIQNTFQKASVVPTHKALFWR